MIEKLVEDRFCDWVWARGYSGLEDALRMGLKGFEEYTDDELKEAVDELVPESYKGFHHREIAHNRESENEQ